ncbi:HdeD family acid-resistance protein [Salinicola endophyticus]|uniref:HdeD family acid-resistance protein n=1 Tax=Salinicola endophyticus TaxID=1949083 RepID=A0ABY8FEI6_9GAMM|nr:MULTISPECIES: DUF308 domain-containing protein [Salinicola]WFF41206.1 HdeD family acid-resistance protein [Salinicola endophyticus]
MATRSLIGRSWMILMAFGVVAVIFGAIAIFKPLGAIAALTWIMGIMALAEGISTLVTTTTAYRGAGKGWLIGYGVFSVLFGLLAIFDPLSMASALLVLVGIWLVIAGVFRLLLALRIRRPVPGQGWTAPGEGWTVLSGVLALLLGILLIASPLSGLVVTALWIGVVALIYGVIQIIAALRVRKAFSGH